MKYRINETILVGDVVVFENNQMLGYITKIIDSPDKMFEWGADEAGLLVAAKPFGRLFIAESQIDNDLVLRNRNPQPKQSAND